MFSRKILGSALCVLVIISITEGNSRFIRQAPPASNYTSCEIVCNTNSTVTTSPGGSNITPQPSTVGSAVTSVPSEGPGESTTASKPIDITSPPITTPPIVVPNPTTTTPAPIVVPNLTTTPAPIDISNPATTPTPIDISNSTTTPASIDISNPPITPAPSNPDVTNSPTVTLAPINPQTNDCKCVSISFRRTSILIYAIFQNLGSIGTQLFAYFAQALAATGSVSINIVISIQQIILGQLSGVATAVVQLKTQLIAAIQISGSVKISTELKEVLSGELNPGSALNRLTSASTTLVSSSISKDGAIDLFIAVLLAARASLTSISDAELNSQVGAIFGASSFFLLAVEILQAVAIQNASTTITGSAQLFVAFQGSGVSSNTIIVSSGSGGSTGTGGTTGINGTVTIGGGTGIGVSGNGTGGVSGGGSFGVKFGTRSHGVAKHHNVKHHSEKHHSEEHHSEKHHSDKHHSEKHHSDKHHSEKHHSEKHHSKSNKHHASKSHNKENKHHDKSHSEHAKNHERAAHHTNKHTKNHEKSHEEKH